MRLPNNYGTITKLPGTRRKPWAVRVTVKEIQSDGKVTSKQKYLSYHETKTQALEALSVWNRTKTDISEPNISISQVYDLWYSLEGNKLASNTIKSYSNAWKKCSPLYALPIRNVRLADLQRFFYDLSETNKYPSLKEVKKVLSLVFSYAFKNDLILKNYASLLDLQIYKKIYKPQDRTVYSLDSIQAINTYLEKNIANQDELPDTPVMVACVLKILLYTGMRVEELLNLNAEDLHLNNEIPYIHIRESKTEPGVRDVPIHPSIIDIMRLYEKFTKFPSSAVIKTKNSAGLRYNNLYNHIRKHSKEILPDISTHNIHETRHTFISFLNLLPDTNPIILKALVGHAQSNITDAVYTHVDLKQKYELICKLPY